MSDTPAPASAEGPAAPPTPAEAAEVLDRIQSEVRRVIVGQDRPVERLLVALLAKGHVLLEGVPGLAKTLAAETLSRTVTGSFSRIQFTPDLLPADVMGTRIFRASKETFDIELGPVFVNFLLADEINRAPAKVQSALLEVMAERQVSIGGKTFPVPDPFLVLATQNPIESEGVYPLPEAQRDRFLMKVIVDYPTAGEEVDIVYRMGVRPPKAESVVSLDELIELQAAADAVRVDRAVVDYAVTVVLATRYPANYALSDIEPLLTYGGSPRASLGLVRAGRALALIRGRDHLVPQDVFDVAPDVLRHRLVLSYEALAQGITPDQVLARVLSTVPAPRQASAVRPAYSATATGPTGTYAPAAAPAVYGAPAAGYGAPAPAGYGPTATAPGYGGPSTGYGPSTTSAPAAGGAWAEPAAAPVAPSPSSPPDVSPWSPDATGAPSLAKPEVGPEGPPTASVQGPPPAPPADEPWPPPGDERSA